MRPSTPAQQSQSPLRRGPALLPACSPAPVGQGLQGLRHPSAGLKRFFGYHLFIDELASPGLQIVLGDRRTGGLESLAADCNRWKVLIHLIRCPRPCFDPLLHLFSAEHPGSVHLFELSAADQLRHPRGRDPKHPCGLTLADQLIHLLLPCRLAAGYGALE